MNNFELEFVEWLRQRAPKSRHLELGIGDDMAILRDASGIKLVSSDILLEGVHFDSTKHRPRDVGHKALACVLSDCAAMAVKPVAALISVAFPTSIQISTAIELMSGVFELAERFDVAVAGGDTARWPGGLVIDVSVFAGTFPGMHPVLRSGARPGDQLLVTGKLGGSLLGRHLTFTPRIKEAQQLVQSFGPALHAMMDVSDGLSLDAWRMAQASDAGIVLWESMLNSAASDDAKTAARHDGRSVLDHVLSDGEDFELLLAVDPSIPNTSRVDLLKVGEVVSEGFQLRMSDGGLTPLHPSGYLH